MKLSIVISTLGNGIGRLEKAVAIRHPSLRYVVVHQTVAMDNPVPPYLSQRADVAVIRSETRGLARSRNIGLEHCQTPYALIADDDVEYVPKGIGRVLEIIADEQPDFALFQIQTPAGQPEYKHYPAAPYLVTRLKHWVSSIEILVNVTKLQKTGIRFDERFGLGARVDRGEEEIFVLDLINRGWKGHYFPVPVVQHPYESSGKQPRSRKEQFFFQGAYDARTAGRAIRHAGLTEFLRHPSRIIDDLYYRRGVRYIRKTASHSVGSSNSGKISLGT